MAQQRQERLDGVAYDAFFVIMDGLGGPPTAQYCALIREGYGLTMPVLYDPKQLMPAAFGYKATNANDRTFVLRRGAVLMLMERHADQAEVDALLDQLLSSE